MNNWRKNAAPPMSRVPATGRAQQASTAPAPTQTAPARQAVGVVPVRVLDAFYQLLPSPAIQQLALAVEVSYNTSDFSVDGGGVKHELMTVPNSTIYVITDFTYYALVPSTDLQGPPVRLDTLALSGSLQFRFLIGERTPFRITHRPLPLYQDGTAQEALELTGWGMLDSPVGSQRTAAFAIYARGGNALSIEVKITDATYAPRFILQKLGAQVHGFALPETEFETIWRRTTES